MTRNINEMECREDLSIVTLLLLSFPAGNGNRVTDNLSCGNKPPNAFLDRS